MAKFGGDIASINKVVGSGGALVDSTVHWKVIIENPYRETRFWEQEQETGNL